MVTEDEKKKIEACVQELLAQLGYAVGVKWQSESQQGFSSPLLSIESGDNLALLIGAEGKNLEALEHIAHLITRRILGSDHSPEAGHFLLDINRYRTDQAIRLVSLARQSVERVIASGLPESLAPMTSYQRRIIHTELAMMSSVETESIGTEPHRRIVIRPASMSHRSEHASREGLKGDF
ncbi:MAG: hypothetical protein A3A33_00665 [Candidatus Yanofskybacteria bacterium RIFCSPLOWO2_01_FULL_49_25]|uniref:R3H domain-containing protein n=1 Tax=Candidatus Yanofskybacteria bacterium RIFCSPLOWO2_01_FULL_49_25 TaxID=1802701 RepID=A0A1F8GWK3_9BACT|nr:MAG: hypothetical protein A3A33_00665 [Candidatus Yanofskybacteria bacterium RIFCSPLOWO2_01_FULL_49_25]